MSLGSSSQTLCFIPWYLWNDLSVLLAASWNSLTALRSTKVSCSPQTMKYGTGHMSSGRLRSSLTNQACQRSKIHRAAATVYLAVSEISTSIAGSIPISHEGSCSHVCCISRQLVRSLGSTLRGPCSRLRSSGSTPIQIHTSTLLLNLQGSRQAGFYRLSDNSESSTTGSLQCIRASIYMSM